MNLTPAQKVRLGTFVFFGMVLLLGSLSLVAGLKIFERRDFYTVRFTDSISGLEESAQVKYNGLRIGRVDRLRIDPHDPKRIEARLALNAGTPLYKGVVATLAIGGLTGIRSVDLQGGDVKAGLLPPDSEIPEGESFTERITGQATQIATKVEMVANQLIQWTGSANRQRIEHLVDSIDVFAQESTLFLQTNRESTHKALESVAKTGDAIAKLSSQTHGAVERVEQEINTTMRTLRRPLQDVDPAALAKAVVNFQGAMGAMQDRLSDKEAGKLIQDLEGSITQVNRVLRDVELSVRAGREDFVTSLRYLRQASEDIREFSRIIAQDPSVLLRGKEAQQ